mgnify:CR=1 FL=1
MADDLKISQLGKSFKRVLYIVKYIWTFLWRRVFTWGILQDPVGRWALAIIFIVYFIFSNIVSYSLFSGGNTNKDVGSAVIDIYGINSILAVLLIYIIIKTLFSRAGALYEMTYNFPMSSKERSLAFIIFEILALSILIFFAIGSSMTPLLLVYGQNTVRRGITSILLPMIIIYTVVLLLNAVINRILQTVRLENLSIIIQNSFLLAIVFWYNSNLFQSLQITLREDVEGKAPTFPTLIFTKIDIHAGALGVISFFLFLVIGLFILVFSIAPSMYISSNENLKTPIPFIGYRIMPYLAQYYRNVDTWLAFIGTAFIYVILINSQIFNPLVSIEPVAFLGVYAYSSTRTIRAFNTWERRGWVLYLYMLIPQLIFILALSFPAFIYDLLSEDRTDGIYVIGALIFTSLITNFIGILFPPEKNNPFSVIIGMIALLGVSVIAVVSIIVFQPMQWLSVLLGIMTILGVVLLSIYAVSVNERKIRCEYFVTSSKD